MGTTYRKRSYEAYVRLTQGEAVVGTATSVGSRRAYLAQMIERHFPPDRAARVLDLGCGAGPILLIARERGYRHLAGIDISPEQVARAHAAGLTEVRSGDLRGLLQATDSDSFDVVIAFDVLEHFTKDELIPLVDEVHRVLRPGGRWVIHVPNGGAPFGGLVRYGDFTHELAFTAGSLRQLLSMGGFASVTCHEDEPVPHGLKSAARWALWQGLRAALRVWVAAETGVTERGVFSQNLLAVALKAERSAGG